MSNPNQVKKQREHRLNTEPDYNELERSPSSTSLTRSKYLPRMSPNLTPRGHLKKLLEKPAPLTQRSMKTNISQNQDSTSFEQPKTSKGSRSPNFGYKNRELDKSAEEKSEEFGKKLLDVTQERKFLEEQYKLMENRVKHLMDENEKIKGKIKQTHIQTKNIIKTREKLVDEEEKIKLHQETIEKQNIEKKERVNEMRLLNEKKRKEKQEQILKEKLRLAEEARQQKLRDQELKEELRREEEIRKNERIWKIALHEKELENSKMYQKIKTRDNAKKVYSNRLVDEEKRAEEVERKIKELEQLEMKLVDDLKHTHLNHLDAYAQMEKVYETRTPRYLGNTTSSNISGISTKSVSPWRKKK